MKINSYILSSFLAVFFLCVSGASSLAQEYDITGHYFPKGTVWLNTDGPMSQNNFENKITLVVVSDFECVECGYYLSTLQEELMQTPGVQIIQVIRGNTNAPVSRKFVLQYIQQYGYTHPVAMVADYSGFQGTGILEVPFFMLYQKSNVPVFAQGGVTGYGSLIKKLDEVKSNKELLQSCYNYQLQPAIMPSWWGNPVIENPTALCADDDNDKLYVIDAAHDRIVELDGAGLCTKVIGSSAAGFSEDYLNNSRFDHPQGICYHEGKLYIADTYNHRIRVADLNTQRVQTICGNGQTTLQKSNELVLGKDPIGLPVGVAYWNKAIFTISAATNEVFQLNTAEGKAKKFADLPEGKFGAMRLCPVSIIGVKDHLYISMNDGSMVQIDKQGNKINVPANDGFTPSTLGEWKGQVIASSLKQNRIMLLGKKGWRFIAGDGTVGNKNGDSRKATFSSPVGLATLNGELFIADRENHELRKLSAPKKGKVRTFSVQLSRELIGEVAAHTFGESVVMDTLRLSKKESKIHVALDLGNYKLLPEWSSVDIDEVTGAYLPTQSVTEDGFTFGINNRFEGLDVYIEVYLMLEDPNNPGIYIVKRSYLSFVLDRVDNAPAAQEQVYKVNILPQ